MVSAIAMVLSVISAYLLGSIPTGYLFAKFLKGIDIRKAGSNNVGATNVFRVVGKLPAIFTLVIDVLKGVLAVTLVVKYSYPFLDALDYDFYRALLGLVTISGHIWPVFLKFKGGKGVATTIGALSVIAPIPLLLSLLIWLIVFIFTNYVSVASIIFGIALPVFSVAFNQPLYTTLFTVTICIINSYKHKNNIKRLLDGEETKIVIFKK